MPALDRLLAAREAHVLRWGRQPPGLCDAPGRVNLIGEHLDYAGGPVLPFAIQLGICVAAEPVPAGEPAARGGAELFQAPDSRVRLAGPGLQAAQNMAWAVIAQLRWTAGQDWPAAPATTWRLSVWSDLPCGMGLSSSAAFCIACAGAVCSALGLRSISPLQLCQVCQAAESAASGVECGLMDQYAVVFGEAGRALCFDPLALSHCSLALELPAAELVIVDSGQPRQLAHSGYNARRAELAAGLPERLRHVATERQRVTEACTALQTADCAGLGRLLTASHASLRDDYAVSTPELDLLCRLLEESGAALGARLCGAGFGGSVLALLHSGSMDESGSPGPSLAAALLTYERQTGLGSRCQKVLACTGARLAATSLSEPVLLREWLSADQLACGKGASA